MTQQPVSIGEINVTGASPAAAPLIGPALERGLTLAIEHGLDAVGARDISVTVPYGASEHEITQAVIAAVARGKDGR